MITIYILKKKAIVTPQDIIKKANFVPNLHTELVRWLNIRNTLSTIWLEKAWSIRSCLRPTTYTAV